MSELSEEDVHTPEEIDAEEQKRFEEGCLRFLIVYLISYVLVGIACTIFGTMIGQWWPAVIGWGWPLFLTVALFLGASLGLWSEKQ